MIKEKLLVLKFYINILFITMFVCNIILQTNFILWFGDTPHMLQTGFQDPATSIMEGVYLFNCSLLIVTISIVV